MATLYARETGKVPGYEIRFFDQYGRRRTLYLGGRKYNEKTAHELLEIVEKLVYYKSNSITVLDKRTLTWLQSASLEIQQKLANFGLIEIPKEYTLIEVWDKFLKQKNDVKESTETTYENAKRRFFEFFKEEEILSELNFCKSTFDTVKTSIKYP